MHSHCSSKLLFCKFELGPLLFSFNDSLLYLYWVEANIWLSPAMCWMVSNVWHLFLHLLSWVDLFGHLFDSISKGVAIGTAKPWITSNDPSVSRNICPICPSRPIRIASLFLLNIFLHDHIVVSPVQRFFCCSFAIFHSQSHALPF